jgi:hypothetical protein
MQLPTVKIREKSSGRIKIVNQTKYADNLSLYTGWEIVSMRSGDASDKAVIMERQQERIETARMHNPKSPAYGDAQLAFEARAGYTINTNAVDESVDVPDVTSAVTVQEPEPTIEDRVIPVIGGVQTVKVRGRKPKSAQDEGDVL